ncbi:hypothetical protein [Streptomyces sp. NBC_00893]|uniref:hypothetical protein n=1 Tax=Streptomyces sp. NBC_00893 TaxID=2975862 RepID=UPI00224DA5EE|nr:hypothetical protein [Streptomyces sp. NBC_00893]MCX4851696.1 hypothetical protein [Streptomyces sp. NBC_00893]
MLGHVARAQSKKTGVSNGFAAAAVIVGWITTALTVLLWTLVLLVSHDAASIHHP